MNKYGTLKVCPKCGGNVGLPRYERETYRLVTGKTRVTNEWIRVTCETCGYSEDELPLDSEVEDEVR